MPTKQQHIQQFRNRLSKDRTPFSEHILSQEQFQGAIDDAVGLFSTVKYTSNSGVALVEEDNPLIALPLDFLDGFNDDLLLSLSTGGIPSNLKFGYSPFNFGYPVRTSNSNPYYNTYTPNFQGSGSASYSYGRQNLSNPILPNSPIRKRPTLTTKVIDGITYPAIECIPTPTADTEIPITYTAKQNLTDDTLVLIFTVIPSNGQTFILDGATFTFVTGSPATSLQIQIGLTISLTTANMATVLTNLDFITEANGQSISISNSTGTIFTYSIAGLTNVTASYTSSIDTIDSTYCFALYDLMKAKTLDYLISQNYLEKEKINEIFLYSQQLVETTLNRLNT